MTLRLALWRALLQLLELENLHRLVTMWTSVILLFAALAFYQVFVTTKAPDVEVAETYLVDDVAVAGATEGLPKLPVLLVEDLLEGIEAEASLSMARWQETERSTISTADAERTSVRSIHALTEIHLPVYVRGGRRPSGLLSDRMLEVLRSIYWDEGRLTPGYANALVSQVTQSDYELDHDQTIRLLQAFKSGETTSGRVSVTSGTSRLEGIIVRGPFTECRTGSPNQIGQRETFECTFTRDNWALPTGPIQVDWEESTSSEVRTVAEVLVLPLIGLGLATAIILLGMTLRNRRPTAVDRK